MDLLEKNMILQTNETLINYGGIDATAHTLEGTIFSSSPFSLMVLGDNNTLLPLQNSIVQEEKNVICVITSFTTGHISKFQLQLEGTDFDIQLKLWKPYPITEPIPNI